MHREYVVSVNLFKRLPNTQEYKNFGGGEFVEWGVDEFDALENAFSKAAKKQEIPDKFKELNKIANVPTDYYFKWSYFRPTGRTKKEYSDEAEPYIKTDARPYIKGLITRFMTRFAVSETETEINAYLKEFEDYAERYKNELTSEIIEPMIDFYKLNLAKIQNGKVLPFNEESNFQRPVDANSVALALKKYGYRIWFNKEQNIYRINEPKYYNRMFSVYEIINEDVLITAEKLIGYWQLKRDFLYVNR